MPGAILEDVGGSVFGRGAELAAVSVFIAAGAAAPAALVIEGEAGIGKTTIVRAALAHASSAGLRVLLARPGEGEVELPYVGLGDLLGSFEADAFASLAGPQREAIEAALARGRADNPVERHALSRGLLEFLRGEGAAGDLLIVIDDVQWLDRPTVSALSFALRRLGPVPVRVLVALRTNGSGPVQPFTFPDWSVQRLTLGPLSTTDLGVLIRERLGQQLSRPRLKGLRNASGGSPMFALELMRQGGASDGARLPTLPLALAERLRELDPGARTAATVAAAALRPSTDMLLKAGVERTDLESAIAAGVHRARRRARILRAPAARLGGV